MLSYNIISGTLDSNDDYNNTDDNDDGDDNNGGLAGLKEVSTFLHDYAPTLCAVAVT